MKTQSYLPQPVYQNQAIQTQSDVQLHDKVVLDTRLSFSLLKLQQPHAQATIPIRVCRVEKLEDNKLVCCDCGRKFPATPEGKIDKGQLILEILAQR